RPFHGVRLGWLASPVRRGLHRCRSRDDYRQVVTCMSRGSAMRRIRYQVACSLDGYIAGPNGEYDWIPIDPDIDFEALYDQFDTLLMGRRTYEEVPVSGPEYGGKQIVVVSDTLRAEEHPGVTVVRGRELARTLDTMRRQPGKDIWLFGGG